jgi:2-C-methyl-D-erythritol 4-phosphate cytidylyltransferase/2-C-methyl-D-erythritol 2,4-cyclodiphosphate synthase
VPSADTIKRVHEGRVVETPARRECWAAQTPQVFRRDWLQQALDRAEADSFLATDDAQLVERIGHAVHVVEGSPRNLKITHPGDLAMAERWLGGDGEAPTPRIGQAFDAHQLVAGRTLWLGGVEIPYGRGLEGHSDGDVLLHAVAGAVGGGDLGTHFPSSDPTLRGVSSAVLLGRVMDRVREASCEIGNVDSTVIAQVPRLAPHRAAMAEQLAKLLDVPAARVNVKVTSTDHLGALGRGEGIAAQASVLLLCRTRA